jgi:uncharacterized protein YidB (DUF937 family)
MARSGFPSMTALLGLLAIAGYQNRDKISEMLGKLGQGSAQGGDDSLLGKLGGLFGNDDKPDDVVGGGVGELVDRFRQNGQGEIADSWVRTGPNAQLAPDQLGKAIGPDVLDALTAKTGLSRDELLKRLAGVLPSAVDQYTPEGRLPAR